MTDHVSPPNASELLAILNLTRHLAEQRMAQPLVEYVAEMVFTLVAAERCLIVLFSNTDHLQVACARDRHGMPINNPDDQVSHSILERVRTAREPLLINDALQDQDLKQARSVSSLNLRSVACVPLLRQDSAIGAIYVENRSYTNRFNHADLIPLILLANQVAAALENVREHEALEQRVAERTQELTCTIERLRTAQDQLVHAEKMVALGNLVAGVAHELRNPLNFVTTLARMSVDLAAELEDLITAQGATISPDLQEVLGYLTHNMREIDRNGQRADGIINLMLLHTRTDAGIRTPLNLNAAIQQALNLAYHSMCARKPDMRTCVIEALYQPDLPLLAAVPHYLIQAFINVFENSCYALWQRQQTDPAFTPTIRVTTECQADQIVVRIWDNGIGIEPQIAKTIFEPFVTTKPPGEGSGLGLALTYDIVVHTHAGTIHVESQPYVSTEFTVHLPIQPPTLIAHSTN